MMASWMGSARWLRDERGTVAVMFGLLAIVLVAIGGAAIDYGRITNIATQTQSALDGAVLAAGRHLQLSAEDQSGAIEIAASYFGEAVTNRLPVLGSNAQFTVVGGGSAIAGEAWADVGTPLIGLLSQSQVRVMVNSKAAFSVGGSSNGGSSLEIALMLDMTGSMCADGSGPCATGTKIDALKSSAKDLINIVIKDSMIEGAARVALVPFSSRVRIGPPEDGATEALMKDLTDLDPTWSGWYNYCLSWDGSGGTTSEDGGSWTCSAWESRYQTDWPIKPCVTDRTGPQEFTDAAPGPEAWLNAHGGDRRPLSWDSGTNPIASGQGLVESDPSTHWNYEPGASCYDEPEANVVVPLSQDRSALNSKIDNFVGYGSTGGALGTAWAWYMLSPNWAGLWTGAAEPGPYSDLAAVDGSAPKLRKIAVLMTDGQYNTFRGWKEQVAADVSNRAKSICTNMKAQGIEIYTVGFDLDSLPEADKALAIETLQSCGSDIEHFYNALNAAQLKQSFQDIAMQLSRLYLVQ